MVLGVRAVVALRRYMDVWRLPGGRTLLLSGVIARLGIGMTPLALLLLVQHSTGRYTPAAIAGGLYALASATIAPIFGRLADRIGPSPVLFVTAVLHPLALIGLLVAARFAALTPIWLTAAVAGATYPPLSAAVRGAWNRLTDTSTGRYHLRGQALALETSLFEIVFVIGPLLVAAFVGLATPAMAIMASAAVTLIGTTIVARSAVMRGWHRPPGHAHTRGLGPLGAPGFPALLICIAGLGLAFGIAGVAVPAYATASGVHHPEGVAGVLLAVWGTGSATGGIYFGTRRPRMSLSRQYAWLLTAVAISVALLAVMPDPTSLGIALVVGGATIAPALTVGTSLVARITPVSMRNEAYTWVITTSVAASSAGSAIAGVLADRPGGVPWAFLLAAASIAVGAAVAGWPRGALTVADQRAGVLISEALEAVA